MPVVVACPKCQSKYQLPEAALGKTIECKKCSTKFPAAVQKPAAAATVGQRAGQVSAASSKYSAGASANELAKFGLDGPIRRQPDPLAERTSPPPKDILGNFAADPGFAAVQAGEKSVKGESQSTTGLDAIITNPYANQNRSTLIATDMSSLPGVGYASLTTAAKIAVGFLAVAAVSLLVITCIQSYLYYLLWDRVQGSPPPIDISTFLNIMRVLVIAAIVFVTSIPLYGIALSMFGFQGYENLKAMGTKELSFGSVVSAFSWLIPLGNFVLPVMTVAELSRASQKPVGDQWISKSAPIRIWIWWGLFCAFWIGPIAVLFMAGLSAFTIKSAETAEAFSLFQLIIFWMMVLIFASSVLLFGLIAFEIAANQDKAWPAARKAKQGTGKVAPAAIPYVYAGLGLMALGLVLISGGVTSYLKYDNSDGDTLNTILFQWGLPIATGVWGLGHFLQGIVKLTKAFR